MKVSVVIPVYNVENYLEDCIKSLLNQDMEDIEFIFVNDCSPDGSLAILERYKNLYPEQITIIDSKVNLRQGGARNLGLAAASGDYIAFVDSDDLIAPNMYSSLYETAQKTQAECVRCLTARIYQNTSYDDIDFEADHPLLIKPSQKLVDVLKKHTQLSDSDIDILMAESIGGVWAGLYSRNLLEKAGVAFPEHIAYEDNFWINIVECYTERIAFCDSTLYFYRTNMSSTTHSPGTFRDRRVIENRLLEEAEQRQFLNRHHDAFEYLYIQRYAINTTSMMLYNSDMFDMDEIKRPYADLQSRFPQWRKNPFYIKYYSQVKRLFFEQMMRFPSVFKYVYRMKLWLKTAFPSVSAWLRRVKRSVC